MSKKSKIKELAESMSLLTECSHCKQKINSKAPFCQYCGTKQKILANKKNCFCIYCGKEIGVNSSFCSFCGKSQKEIVIPVKPKTTEKKIKDKNKNPRFLYMLFTTIYVFFKTLLRETYRGGYKLMHGRYPKK